MRLRPSPYLWITVAGTFALTSLGAVVTLYASWANLHRGELLGTFIVLGFGVMIATVMDAWRSGSENASLLTGGDTFCYLDIIGQQFPLSVASLRKNGEGPLYNVKMKLQVLVPAAGGGQLGRGRIDCSLGDMPASNKPAFGDISLQPFVLRNQDSVDFHVAFQAKNGYWHQILCLRKVGEQWLKATKVSRTDYGVKLYGQAKSKVIFEDASPDFPDVGIKWEQNSLLYH